MKRSFLVLLFFFLTFSQYTRAQCFEIESILVDACGPQEGFSEMVRFRVGPNPLNTATLNVNWPNNAWQGLIQNAFTASQTALLNAEITNAGGCAQLIEPSGGILPANSTVILVTSFNLNTAQNPFGAISEDIYIIYQNNPTNSTGHFANFGVGIRTFSMTISGCFDIVSYDRSLLVNQAGLPSSTNADGSTVWFDPDGTPTYVNFGCFAPVPPFLVNIEGNTLNVCAGTTLSLSATAVGQQSLLWSAPTGAFSDTTVLNPTYEIPEDASGTILLTLTAVNVCGNTINDILQINISPLVNPNFSSFLILCNGEMAPPLESTSPNGILGFWSPSAVDMTASGTYVFTPNPNQCANDVILQVTIEDPIVPDFPTALTLCSSDPAPTLASTSPNNIIGTWSPSILDMTASSTYVFTPNPNQCATEVTLTVTIEEVVVPNFVAALTLCSSDTAPSLNTTSPNGINGTWSPSVVDMTTSDTYVFTPDTDECASEVTLTVTIEEVVVPSFATALTLCSSDTAPSLAITSPNGITGSWSPDTVDMTASGTYVFTPNPNQCASEVTFMVTIEDVVVPDFATAFNLCSNETAPTLATTSPNGITGTWSPSAVDMTISDTYVFTPNPNQCASEVILTVSIEEVIVPNFATSLTLCSSDTAPSLNTTSPNGINGTWSPSVVDMSTSDTYVFTPDTDECASEVTLTVTIEELVVPNFATVLTLCSSDTAPSLNTTSPNGITGSWSPSSVDMTASGTYVFTPNPNQCASEVTFMVTIEDVVVPDFATAFTLCSNEAAPTLATTSSNGITGAWNPSAVDMTVSDTYVFTPNPNQCATEVTLLVTIEEVVVPNFVTALTLCSSDTAPSLNTTSPNGINGTWNPSVVDMNTSDTYVFTPNTDECASEVTLLVTIEEVVVPNFATALTLCSTDTTPSLNTTSPNGITGSWSPDTVDMTASGTYAFTPNPNQCAGDVTLQVTIENPIVPDFPTALTLCSSDTAPSLNTTSPNGITGTWSPDVIDMTTSGTYTFTPAPSACADTTTLEVTIQSITGTITGVNALCVDETTVWTASLSDGVWSSDDPSIVTVDAAGTVVGVAPGTTTIRYFVQGLCDVELTQDITIYELPSPTITDVFICLDPLTGDVLGPVLLESGLNEANYTFIWSLNEDVLGTGGTLLVSETGIYSLTTTHNLTGCSSTVTLGVLPSSAAIATVSIAEDFQRNQTITVSVTGGSGDYVYILNNGPVQSSPVFSPVPQGENTIIVRDLNGCDDVVLTIYSFNYPHFFTPNDDGYNDTWIIEGLDEQLNARLFIYDRYGKLLKTLRPSVGEGWDGTYLGAPLPSTDYWFTLLYTNRQGNEREFKAHFSLKR